MTILTEQVRRANKDHTCDACYWWDRSNFGEKDVTDEEWLVIEDAKRSDWKILKGTQYVFQSSVYDGAIHTFKARPDVDEICKKYGLYSQNE